MARQDGPEPHATEDQEKRFDSESGADIRRGISCPPDDEFAGGKSDRRQHKPEYQGEDHGLEYRRQGADVDEAAAGAFGVGLNLTGQNDRAKEAGAADDMKARAIDTSAKGTTAGYGT